MSIVIKGKKDSYKLEEKIAEGGASTIYSGVAIKSGKKIVFKVPKLEKGGLYALAFENECEIMNKFKGKKHLIQMIENIQQPNRNCIIYPRFKGSLVDLLKEGSDFKLDESVIKVIFRHVCYALFECHKKGIAHLDIKPGNILQGYDEKFYLTDFGSACEVYTQGVQFVTKFYASPEIVGGRCLNPICSDIWSLGVLLYELFTGELPFKDPTDAYQCIRLFYIKLDTIFPAEIAQLLKSMFQLHPESRITVAELLKNPWVAEPNVGFSSSRFFTQALNKLRRTR